MREQVEESCSFSPRASGNKTPEENTMMSTAPREEFPEEYYVDSVLQPHSHDFHHSTESRDSWAASETSAKEGGRGTKGFSSPLPFNQNISLGFLDLLHCSTSALSFLCPFQVRPKAESRMNAN